MKCHEIRTEGIVSLIAVDDTWQVKWVNTGVRAKAKADIAAANRIAELLLLVLGVDNEYFAADHHASKSLELYGK